MIDYHRIRKSLLDHLSTIDNIHSSEIEGANTFFDIGVRSKDTLSIAAYLEELTGKSIHPSYFWEYPRIDDFCKWLSSPESTEESTTRQLASPHLISDPIAVIGMACRFPGASTIDAYWNLLCNGENEISSVSQEAKPSWFHPELNHQQYLHRAGTIKDISTFDYRYFNIPFAEAQKMDPQQRMILELAVEAFEDAGIMPQKYYGDSVGTFVGIWNNDYGRQNISTLKSDIFDISGNALSICANRIAYQFNFTGPSMAIDTACSSSLTALHLACQSIRLKESSIAIAAGVNLMIDPHVTVSLAKANMLSNLSQCHTFDSRANGFVRGEGAGLVLLKPLSQAVLDGNKIYALVHSTGINQDGHSNGLTAPNPAAQERLIRRAVLQAGITQDDLQYIELHGTGTALGDPVEAYALGKFLAGRDSALPKCLLGSVKTNIGHLESAAGIAGFIKTALSLFKGKIPPSLHFNSPNDLIPYESSPFEINTKLTPYPANIAQWFSGVSSFGFGGSNAHAILSNLPDYSHFPISTRGDTRPVQHRKICFIFPGFSEEMIPECHELLYFSHCFKAVIEECDQYISDILGWSLLQKISDKKLSTETAEIVLPATVAIQIALSRLWISCGVEPDVLLGHSMGEITAAHLSGAITLRDAMRIICYISKAIAHFDPEGAMLLVSCSSSDIRRYIADYRISNVFVSAENTANRTILSGEKDAIHYTIEKLKEINIPCSLLSIQHPYHTEMLHDHVQWIMSKLGSIETSAMQYPMFSTIQCRIVESNDLGLQYWFDNLTKPVKFHASYQTILKQYRVDTFLEMNPTLVMTKLLSYELKASDNEKYRIYNCFPHDGIWPDPFFHHLRELFEWGVIVDWLAISNLKRKSCNKRELYLIPFSANSDSSLKDWMHACKDYLLDHQTSPELLADFSYQMANRRSHYPHRKVMIVQSTGDLITIIDSHMHTPSSHVNNISRKVAFVFSGQGNQWLGLSNTIYHTEPVYRSMLNKIDRIFCTHANWSIAMKLEQITAEDLSSTDIIQPIIFAIQVAFFALLKSWGINPDGVIGHSMGEVAAAYVAGHLTLHDAVYLIYQRGKILHLAKGLGSMIVIQASVEDVLSWLKESEDALFISAINSDKSLVLSGAHDTVLLFENKLKKAGCLYKKIKGDYPFHSPIMTDIVKPHASIFDEIKPRLSEICQYKTSIAEVRCQEIDASYWTKNILNTVNFKDGIKAMLQDGYNTFVEIGVDQILSASIVENMASVNQEGTVLSVMKKDDCSLQHLYSFAGDMYKMGFALTWKNIYPGFRNHLNLPHYPWQRKECWLDYGRRSEDSVMENLSSNVQVKTDDLISENTLQEDVKNILLTLLSIDSIDMSASFIALGGNSLCAVQFCAKIKHKFGVTLLLKDIFMSRTINMMLDIIMGKIHAEETA